MYFDTKYKMVFAFIAHEQDIPNDMQLKILSFFFRFSEFVATLLSSENVWYSIKLNLFLFGMTV